MIIFLAAALLTGSAEAMTLHQFITSHPSLSAHLKASYRRALDEFEQDEVYCSNELSYPGMEQSCRRGVDLEHQALLKSSFGADWRLDSEIRPSPLGPVLTFRKLDILPRNSSMTCEFAVSIPSSGKPVAGISFDYYCDH